MEYCWDGEVREGSARGFQARTASVCGLIRPVAKLSSKSPSSSSLWWPGSAELPVQIPRQNRRLKGFLVLLSLVSSTCYAAFPLLALN